MAYTTAGLVGWLDYSDLSTLYTTSARTTLIANTTGTAIGGIANKAPSATAHASANGPVLGNMGTPRALLLSGASQSIVSIGGIASQFNATAGYVVGTFYRAFQPASGDAAGTTRRIMSLYNSGANGALGILYVDGALKILYRTGTGTATTLNVGNIILDQVNYVEVRCNADGTIRVRLNSLATVNLTRDVNSTAFSFDALRLDDLSSGSTGANWFKGNDGEFLAFNTALSDTDADTNFTTLKAKWPAVATTPTDITLTSSYDFLGDADGNEVLAGSYGGSGTPATLWAQYINTTSGLPVAAMANTGAVFSGANFTGGSLTKPTADGTYSRRFSVRDSTPTEISNGIAVGAPTIERGLKVGVAGSSTTRRWYEDGGATPPAYLSVYSTVDNVLHRNTIGAGCRGFATGIYLGVGGIGGRTCPIRMITAGEGGVSIDSYADKTLAPYVSAIAAFRLGGAKLDLLIIGCRDVNTDSSASPSREGVIRTKQQTVQSNFRGDLGQPNLKIQWIGTTRRPSNAYNGGGSDDTNDVWTASRGRHITSESDPTNTNVKLGSTSAGAELQDDNQHPSTAEMFNSGRQNAHRFLGGTRGSRFVSAAVVGSAMRFTAVHPHGTDFSLTTGILGFDVFDKSGVLVSTGSASRVSATTIDQPFTDNGNGPFHGFFLGGVNPGGQTYAWDACLRDNSTDVCNGRGIPVEPTVSAVGQMLYGTQVITLTN